MTNNNLHLKKPFRSALLVLLLCAAGMPKGYAYNFSAVCETGQTLYYNITDAEHHYVELAPPSNTSPFWKGYTKPVGAIILPEYVYDANDNQYLVTSIGNYAFYDCSGLTSDLTIPNSVTSIGMYAFVGCNGFTDSLTIPNSVTSIGTGAFYNCYGLTGDLIIPNSVTTIGNSAFYRCYGLTGDLIIGNSVTTIGGGAFDGCRGLTGDLVIPNSVTSIGNGAFDGCWRLTGDLTIPNSVTSIGTGAFRSCLGLTLITIPNSVTSIGNYPFSNCSGLEQILVESGNTVYDSRENCNAIIHTSTNELISGCKNTIIPNSVTSIGIWAFSGCSGLTGELNISNSVTSIGDYAFSGCSGLTGDLIIPNSVTSIGDHAFHGCSGLTGDLIIPNSVTSIGNETFYNCSGLTSITIPNSVTSIGNYAFSGCSGLTGDLIIPNSVTSIGNGAFSGCSGLTSIIIPNSVTSIGNYVFGHCSALTSIAIGNSVTSIGTEAFCNCSSLTSITIGNSVTSIGNYAFYGCSDLSSIIMLSNTPPTMGAYNHIIGPNNYHAITIYVPYESLNAYKTASYWNSYALWIYPMAYKSVPGYGEGEGNWSFIASPLVEEAVATSVDSMITESDYDLYRFNQIADLEWENYKQEGEHYHFNLTNGQGYLYSNAEDVNIIFKGEFNEDDTKTIGLAYDANANLAGWNLVGNPFPVQAYANRSYYVMNEAGTAIEPVAVSMETAIPTCTGVMVKADNEGESVTFSKTAPAVQPATQGVLQIAVAQNNARGNAIQDKAIVSFNEGDELSKFIFNKDNALLYIPRGKNNYAIAYAKKTGEMPLNFEAKKNGSYTLSVNTETAELDYLHLIDNLTGNDIDLLAESSYTFEAKTKDYASRFRLVFITSDADDTSASSEAFAFINHSGNLTILGIEGEATLQVIDILGHMLSSETFNGSIEKKMDATTGVYILRLINGDDVKVQKIVIK